MKIFPFLSLLKIFLSLWSKESIQMPTMFKIRKEFESHSWFICIKQINQLEATFRKWRIWAEKHWIFSVSRKLQTLSKNTLAYMTRETNFIQTSEPRKMLSTADQYRRFRDSCKCALPILSFFFAFVFF